MSENTTGPLEQRNRSGVSRRRVLQSGAALAGLSAGSGALTGFPTIWAQNIKDITLFHAGPPVAAIPQIGEQATRSRLHDQDAGDREYGSAEPLSVAVHCDRCRR